MRGWFIVNKAHAKHQQTTNQSSLQFFLRAFILATILAKRRLTFNKTTQKCVCVTFAKWKKVNSYVSDNFLYLRFDAQKSINYNNNDRFDQNAKMRIKVLLSHWQQNSSRQAQWDAISMRWWINGIETMWLLAIYYYELSIQTLIVFWMDHTFYLNGPNPAYSYLPLCVCESMNLPA